MDIKKKYLVENMYVKTRNGWTFQVVNINGELQLEKLKKPKDVQSLSIYNENTLNAEKYSGLDCMLVYQKLGRLKKRILWKRAE